jgi:large subunit ribosomal protein L24
VMAAKIKKGDRVVVLAGKDKGRQGQVLKVLPKDNRVVVGGVNMVKRHTRPTQADPQGGIKNKEAALHISNVAYVDPKSGEPTRVGFRIDGDTKVRVAKKSGEVIDG